MKKPIFFMGLLFAILLCSCGKEGSPTSITTPTTETPTTTVVTTPSLTTEAPTTETPTTTIPKEDDKVDVIFLAGQSNAEGHTHISELRKRILPAKFDYYSREMTTNIKFYCDNGKNKSNGFTNVHLGQGVNSSRFGPEIGMAEAFEEAELKRNVIIIKYCLGATSIYSDWRSFSSGNSGKLFDDFLEFGDEAIQEIEEQGLKVNIRGLCWMQGEADSTEDRMTNLYQTYEKNLFDDIYTYFSDKIDDEFHIVDAYISDCTTWKNYEAINAAKEANAEENPNHHTIDTISEGLAYNQEPTGAVDAFHYDSTSMILLGKLFGQKIIEVALKD